MKPTANNVRQTMLAQIGGLVDRLATVQAMADGMPDSNDGIGTGHGHSDPMLSIVTKQAEARQVLAAFAHIRILLNSTSVRAASIVPVVVSCCFHCGEPTDGRPTKRWNEELYHQSPCLMRARRAAAPTYR